MLKARLVAAVLVAVACAPAGRAAEPAGSPEFFEKKVRPVLVEHCFKCHGDAKGKEPKGGLRLDSRAGLLKGGDNGPALVPGDPGKSRLIEAVRFQNADLQMPPKGKLPDAVVADLTAWVKAGAVWPGDAVGPLTGTAAFDLAKRKKDHWAWQPVRPQEVPPVRDAGWPAGAVDRFILSKLESKGLRPAPAADRRVWIRRVTFDLIGLPPAPAEIDAFLADTSADAERAVVDRLLGSPHFGERWGRHWLDLVRYAETRGHEFDALIPNAYQYRDYVIRALNADVPYDRFVQEHLAGDLLKDPRRHPAEGFNESILGTGFWFLGEEVHSPVDIRQDQADRFDNRIDVLTKAFCALTVSCARCHDHKFDAISTKDYYALYGLVESSGYRQVRFDTLEDNRRVAAELDELNDRSARQVAAALARDAEPLTRRTADYLLAARTAIRSGVEFRPEGPGDLVFEDFESGTYANWAVTGTAFGDRPHTLETIAPYQGKINAGGKYFVNSHDIRGGGDTSRGDAHTGTMTSKEFVVAHRYITMLVGGGSHAGKTCVNLRIDGKVVRTATGRDSNQMHPVRWDVADLKGKTARIEIVDDKSGGWGNVGVDDIVFSDRNGRSEPKPVRAAEFSDAFRARVAEAATRRKLEAAILTSWVEATLRAETDPADPFHVWAKVAAGPKTDEQKALAALVASVRAAKPMPLPPGTEVVVNYATSPPDQWLPDDASFGTRPRRPGDMAVDGARPRFVDTAAAEFDRTWDVAAVPSRTESDHGVLGKRVRAGRSIRTPAFKVSGKVHYLVRGAATAFAAVDNHTLVAGPLHGKLMAEFPVSTAFRWVAHDLSGYQGHHVHVEFTPAKDSDFALTMVVQGPNTPAAPAIASFLPDGELKTIDELAAAYGRAASLVVARLRDNLPAAADDARMANVLLRVVDSRDVKSAAADFAAGRTRITQTIRASSRLAPAIWEGTGVDEHVFIRGSPKGLGEPVPRRFLEALAGTGPVARGPGSGRLELARTLTDPGTNPFIARVQVNRVWHHLFGRGLVGSVDNFGVMGEAPTHPELLDFLADRFVRDGWSVKRLIRDLVLSSTYGMSAHGDAAADAADPQNLLVHKMRLRRLEGEAIRDAMLAVSGRLDPAAFGPPIPVHLTPFLDGRGKPDVSGPLDGDGRRSVYLSVRRNFLNPFLLAFDTPIPFSSVGRRQVSNVPAQALILLNDPFVHQQADRWAKAVCSAVGSTTNRLAAMYRTAFGRDPTHGEIVACLDFLIGQAARRGTTDADVKVWADLAHTLFNTKEFIYLD